MIGDLNAQYDTLPVSYPARRKQSLFHEFISANNLIPVNKSSLCSGLPYTFLPLETTIDYILVTDTMLDCIQSCRVFSAADADIASDHAILECVLKSPLIYVSYPYHTSSLE